MTLENIGFQKQTIFLKIIEFWWGRNQPTFIVQYPTGHKYQATADACNRDICSSLIKISTYEEK